MLVPVLLTAALLQPAPAAEPPRPATPPRQADWALGLALERGQEFVYRGSFTEECSTGTVQYQRAYRLETRLFVLDAGPTGAGLACMTTLRQKEAPAVQPVGFKDEADGRHVRVERLRVDPFGKVSAGLDLAPPLEGPPTVDVSAFVELPRGRISAGQAWETKAGDGPATRWTAADSELVQGVRCAVLKGVQQSADWDQPRADRKAWRRTDTVWVSPRSGVALKVERVVELREAAHTAPTQKCVFKADLESTLPYPGQLRLDREADLTQAVAFREAALPLLATPNRFTPQLNALLKRVTSHLDQTPPTPYRQAILQVKAQVEAGLRGEPAVSPAVGQPQRPAGLRVGEPAPDFVATQVGGQQTVGLKGLRGKPVVLAFYNPNSALTPDVLAFLGELAASTEGKAQVVALSVVDDAAVVQKQLAELKVSVPVLHGAGLRLPYEVDATPRVVVIDGQGYVRGAYTGWGREMPREITGDLKPWLDRK